MRVCANIMKAVSGSGHRCMAEAEAELSSALSKVKRTDSDSVLPTCVTLQSGRHKDLRA